MQIPTVDQEILNSAYSYLHDAVGNVNCLYNFISKKYPYHKDIEYSIYIHSLYKAQNLEKEENIEVPCPVFGKEINMGNKEPLLNLIKNNLRINKIWYIDSDGGCEGNCVNEALNLYEIEI